MNLTLNLTNPLWRDALIDGAEHAQAQGLLDFYFEANQFTSDALAFLASQGYVPSNDGATPHTEAH